MPQARVPGPAPMSQLPLDQKIAALRRFARFFGQRLSALEAGPAGSSYSATEVRVLAELAANAPRTVTALSRSLGLDAGYLSRVLRRLETTGIVARAPHAGDSRQQPMALTEAGRAEVATIESIATARYAALVRSLPAHVHTPILDAMERIEGAFGTDVPGRDATPYLLRPHRTGDVSFVVQRAISSLMEEFELRGTIEADALRVAADALGDFDVARDCIWIAERNGVGAGTVFVRRGTGDAALLTFLHVESQARGIGIGRRLISEAVTFARDAGYRTIEVELLDVMKTARLLFHAAAFRHVRESQDTRFGRPLTRQVWQRALDDVERPR